jgi:hypothetical protein
MDIGNIVGLAIIVKGVNTAKLIYSKLDNTLINIRNYMGLHQEGVFITLKIIA